MDGLSSKVKGDGMDVFQKLLEDFCEEWPDFLPLFLGNYESAYGTGIRARLRAAIWWLRDRHSESTKCATRDRIIALLLLVLQLIEDDPEGIALIAPRLIPAGAGAFGRVLGGFCQEWPRFAREIPGIEERLKAAMAVLRSIYGRDSKSGRRVIEGLLRVLRTIEYDPEGSYFPEPCDRANEGEEEDADSEGVAPLARQADAQPTLNNKRFSGAPRRPRRDIGCRDRIRS